MRRAPLAAAAVALATILGGCGGGDPTTASPEPAAEPAAVAATAVDISDFKFGPEAITVGAGDTVTWTSTDDAPHTATADDSSFDTGDLGKGDTAEATFDEPGTYTYYCRFHAFMNGTVVVE